MTAIREKSIAVLMRSYAYTFARICASPFMSEERRDHYHDILSGYEDEAARRDETMAALLAVGDELLERLNLFISGAGDECTSEGQECWENGCAGIVGEDENDPYDAPSACDICGTTCDCTRCSDRKAIQRWLEAKNDTVSFLDNPDIEERRRRKE